MVTSGSGYATDQQSAMEVGADEYLIKPFKGDDLIRLLERQSARQTSVAAAPVPPHKAPASLPADQPPRLKFWGVRGSIPTPGPSTVQYGGDTFSLPSPPVGDMINPPPPARVPRLPP